MKHKRTKILTLIILAGLIVAGAFDINHLNSAAYIDQTTPKQATSKTKVAVVAPSPCDSNTLAQVLIVSISQRHTWACATNQQLISTPVITGNENLASDLTPTGTYHILSKQTKVSLVGCDTDNPSNCWNDFVNYDMIFLYNQYGHYDFHDATWRAPTDFGAISPNSTNASHGCIETPLAAMTWIYNWATVGTTVEIES